jgi:hypothetical protein
LKFRSSGWGVRSVVSDLVLFPHCDLHMVLPSAPVAPELRLKVCHRTDPPAGSDVYAMTDVTSQCTFEFFAPNNTPGERFLHVPIVDSATGLVTATTAGVYLFQVSFGSGHYIVGRLQVHKEFVGWWFGIDSITAALDPDPNLLAHAQPSLYAKFKDDAGPGTDAIGDITGHRYVTLNSSDTNKVVVSPEDGRLRGIAETETSMDVTGTFPGVAGPPQPLHVRVVNYSKNRNALVPVRVSNVANASELHNILFIPEGFTVSDADRKLFDKIVEKAANDMFEKGRHQPFGLLEKSFNVFKAYLPSQDHAVTCGFRVTDTESGIPLGSPIPYDHHVEEGNPNIYTMEELVAHVGLPKRGENREFPKTWNDQKLPDFESSKVNQKLIDAWKAHQSEGILHARDTVFGLYLGQRLADRRSRFATPVHPPAVGDVPGHADLQPFVARLYEFFRVARPPRTLTPDPRRHSPRVQAGNIDNPGNSIMRFINGLRYSISPFQPIGTEWTPAANFKPSRGLVALITYDGLDGGTNFNNLTITALTLQSDLAVSFAYANTTDKREMRRTPPPTLEPDFDGVTNTVAHEFGHSFNLDDEYETSRGDGTGADAGDSAGDNIASLGFLRIDASSRRLNMDKVKWFELQRMKVSSRLTKESEPVPGGIKVTVGRDSIGQWVDVKKKAQAVSIRNLQVSSNGRQLPLEHTESQFLPRLDIGEINEAAGTLVLTGPEMPANPPKFAKGSALYLPLKNESGELLVAVEKKVLERLNDDGPDGLKHLPLNLDPENVIPNSVNDVPRKIVGFEPPCRPSTLVGVFEGGDEFAGAHYRPTGACKMRDSGGADEGGEYCFVCKWLIVNRVDPSFHTTLSEKFYPKATKKKKNG